MRTHSHRRLLGLLTAGLLGLAALTACEPVDDLLAEPAGDPASAPPAPGVVTADLEALPVAPWAAMTGYKRDRFSHWDYLSGGCDTRDEVLRRDGTGVVTDDDCRIIAGSWFSVYDGQTFADPSDIDIDHMVPLANAWRTGAADWTDDQRSAFANDMSRPQLIPVSASSNRSKGDQDPSQWRPPRQDYWCTYAQSWIEVKTYWRLWVTADEKAALAEMLATC